MKPIILSNLSDIAKESTFRTDFGFIDMDKKLTADAYYSFDDLFIIIQDNKVEDIANFESFKYAEIGNTNSFNQVFPNELSWDNQDELNEPLFKKIKKGDIIKVKAGDILISKVRPYLKKFIFIDDENSDIFFTSAFIHIRPKSNNKILYYALKSIFLLNLMSISRQGKGYPTISTRDLKYLKFKKSHIDNLFASSTKLNKLLEDEENKIRNLYSTLKTIPEIVNKTFFEFIGISIKEIQDCYRKIYNVKIDELNSYDIRSSVRFNNPKYIVFNNAIFTDHIFEEFVDGVQTSLGRQMSPDFIEEESDVFYINTNSIKYQGFDESVLTPISDDFFSKNQKLKVKKGDILLIASGEGSIGRSCIFDSDLDCITSQFIMKIHPKKETDTVFLNYYMQSFYFQFLVEKFKKGKGNMTNIFVNQFLKFPVFYPNKEIRDTIVKQISEQIKEQQIIQNNISEIREKIEYNISSLIS